MYPCELFLYISYFFTSQGIAFARECFQTKDDGHVSIRGFFLNAIFIPSLGPIRSYQPRLVPQHIKRDLQS